MREIKFRAWDKNNCHMVQNIGGDILGEILTGKRVDLELLQYTGLKDKNGKEIYERDLLKAYGRNDGKPCEVIFTDGSFKGKYSTGSEFTFELDRSEIIISMIEVVGNFFENPELGK